MLDHDAIRELVAQGNSASKIAEIVGKTKRQVIKFVLRHNLGPWPGNVARPRPEDFEAMVDTMGYYALMAHYRCSKDTMARWRREIGFVKVKAVKPPRPVTPPRPAIQRFKNVNVPKAPTENYQRDMSPTGLAADILRRDRWAVFRCDDTGKQSIGGKYWICGRKLVDKRELMERAERAAQRLGVPIPWTQAA